MFKIVQTTTTRLSRSHIISSNDDETNTLVLKNLLIKSYENIEILQSFIISLNTTLITSSSILGFMIITLKHFSIISVKYYCIYDVVGLLISNYLYFYNNEDSRCFVDNQVVNQTNLKI